MKIIGKVTVNFSVGGIKDTSEFLYTDYYDGDLLLGTNYFKKKGVILDYRQSMVKWKADLRGSRFLNMEIGRRIAAPNIGDTN